MKNKILITLISIALIFTGCQKNDTSIDSIEEVIPVKVLKINEIETEKTLTYLGIISPEELKKISFKYSGNISRIFVQKGDIVKEGDKLICLDNTDMIYSLDAAKAQMDAAKAQYDKALNGASDEDIDNAKLNVDKAQEAYDYTLDNYNKYEKLFKEGAISKAEYEKVELELNLKESDMSQTKNIYEQVKKGSSSEEIEAAEELYNQAKADYEYKLQMINDTELTSSIDGYITDVLYEEGELVPAGYPVIVIRNKDQIVKVGITQKDIDKIENGMKAYLDINGEKTEGKITNISDIPDEQTLAYDAEISLDNSIFRIGEIAEIKIPIALEKGIWIPIDTVMSKGDDFVYIVEEKRVVKKRVKLQTILGSMVQVIGLQDGDEIVVDNACRVKAGDKIKIVK